MDKVSVRGKPQLILLDGSIYETPLVCKFVYVCKKDGKDQETIQSSTKNIK